MPLANEYVSKNAIVRAYQVPHREMLECWGGLCVFLGPGDWTLTDSYGVQVEGFRHADPGDWIIKHGTRIVSVMSDAAFRNEYMMVHE